MAPAVKASPSASSAHRIKKTSKKFIITFKLSPATLSQFDADDESNAATEVKASPSTDVVPPSPAAEPSPMDAPSASNSNTPAPSGTDDAASAMPPPTEAVKKGGRGVKRTADQAEGVIKVRGKPGPKKKPKPEEGGDSAKAPAPAAHKLGPRANQGAINAGLRALDRSGKPCRKWQKGSFKIKSFTGSTWDIPRWRAPPKTSIMNGNEESTSGGSSKENKDSSQVDSEKSSAIGADVEMGNVSSIAASSPPPPPVVAASA